MSHPVRSGDIQSRNVGGGQRTPKSGSGNKLVRVTPITTANWRNVIWELSPSPPIGGVVCLCCLRVCVLGDAFLAAYRDYLERMFQDSDDLVGVDVFSVPLDVDVRSPRLAEWADVG